MMPRRASTAPAFILPVMLALATAGSVDSLAQERAVVDQIVSGASADESDPELPQITPTSSDASGSQQVGHREQRPTAGQLSPEGRSVPAVRQLYSGGPTAQPAEALSRPAEGRKEPGMVQRVAGSDRCDAAVTDRHDERCSQVIETRSAEFEKPHPATLTPEQRLLMSQQQPDGLTNTKSLARRLGSAGDPQSVEEQGIAASVTPVTAPPVAGVESKQDIVMDPAVQAIVNAIVTNAQR